MRQTQVNCQPGGGRQEKGLVSTSTRLRIVDTTHCEVNQGCGNATHIGADVR